MQLAVLVAGVLLATLGSLIVWGVTRELRLSLVLWFGVVFGFLAGATAFHALHRRAVDSLRGNLTQLVGTTDLVPLSLIGAKDIDLLIKDLNDLLTNAQQRITLLSAIETASRIEAAEVNRDKLTGLYNRRFLDSYLDEEVNRTKALRDEMSVIMADVDHFKHYNDTNGHQMGDKVLQAVASLIESNVRALDRCVRYGGEEFLILLPRTTLERAYRTAERIRQAIEIYEFPARESQPEGRVTMSLGVASLPRHAQDGQELVHRADEALYAAKQAGRNRVLSAEEKTQPLSQRQAAESP
jgi:diguanylate cyclase (GGDEF)-like protein